MLAAPAANQLLVPTAAAAASSGDGSWLYDLDCSGISDALHSNRTLDQNRNPSIMPLR